MSKGRPTQLRIDPAALLHNLQCIKREAPLSHVVAMVKANAYGCKIQEVIPVLEGQVDAFGLISIKEALAIQKLGSVTPCIIFQGVFTPDEWQTAAREHFICAIHQQQQLTWLLQTPLPQQVTVWIKINTGMNRLGFQPHEVEAVIQSLSNCPWVTLPLTMMTHFANADLTNDPLTTQQIHLFKQLSKKFPQLKTSVANSAAIFQHHLPQADFIRPGISLYGVSPFSNQTGIELGLRPVMHFTSHIINIYMIAAGESVGYGARWVATRPSRLGIIPVGYGDGYPRVVQSNTPVWIQGYLVPIVGTISMDSIVVDLTDFPSIKVLDPVELWGTHLLVEYIAKAANTIPYELLCKVIDRS
jgi:alanine racemase